MATAEAIEAYGNARKSTGLGAELSPSAVARIVGCFSTPETEEAAYSTGTTTNPSSAASRVGGPFGAHPTASVS